ncbi:MAG: NYN domain-containing protein [Gemmatimonadetes bacterium]|nr:NYN domain-containing protein [Gemmatimonadota bacterium]
MAAQFSQAPHQGRPAVAVHTAPNAALLIDFDNVTMGIRSDLSKELKNLLNSDIIKGKVAVQRAYADWRRYPQYIVPLAEASVDLIFAPAYGSSRKNATDIRLAIDALELVFTRPEIGTYILLSGDSDFSSLVLKLKEYGKYVIGVGIRESSSDLLVQNCDEYYSYSALTGLTRAADEDTMAEDPWVLAGRAARRMVEQGDVMRSDRLKQVMLELDPNFNERELGFSRFNRFLAEATAKGVLRLKKLENGQYEVGPPDAGEPEAPPVRVPEARPAPARAEGRRVRGGEARRPAAVAPAVVPEPAAASRPADLRASYELLRRALADLAGDPSAGVRDSDAKRRMLELSPGWDESTLGFGKFSRFLRQAHDAEVIDVQKAENGTYRVFQPAAEPRRAKPEPRERRVAPRRPAQVAAAPAAAAATEPLAPAIEHPAAPGALPDEQVQTEEPTATAPAALPAGPEPAAAQAAAEPRPTAPPAPPRVSAAVPSHPPVKALGFRRGTRGRPSTPAAPPPLLPGQTVPVQDTDVVAAPPNTSAAHAPAPRAQEPDLPEELGLPREPEKIVRYIAHRYKGVGKKSAETLVDAFGTDVFRVLGSEPDRVRAALGDGRRADALLEAWRLDHERRTAQRAGSSPTQGTLDLGPVGGERADLAPGQQPSAVRPRGSRRSGRARSRKAAAPGGS